MSETHNIMKKPGEQHSAVLVLLLLLAAACCVPSSVAARLHVLHAAARTNEQPVDPAGDKGKCPVLHCMEDCTPRHCIWCRNK